MGILRKYAVPVKYELYDHTTKETDSEGFYTGEETIVYKQPKTVLAHVSADKGSSQAMSFGNLGSFDKVVIFDGTGLGIDENTLITISNEPYNVYRVSETILYTSIAIKKVKIS